MANEYKMVYFPGDELFAAACLLGLPIHKENAVVRPVTDGFPCLGFMIFPDHRWLKARKGLAFQRKLRHLLKTNLNEKIRSSVPGWINHIRYVDTFGLRKSVLDKAGLLAQEQI